MSSATKRRTAFSPGARSFSRSGIGGAGQREPGRREKIAADEVEGDLRGGPADAFAVAGEAQAALGGALRRSQGDVVNVLSVSSRIAFPNCSAYTAAKFGARGLTSVLRRELRADGIRVMAVMPGMTDTRMMGEFDFPVRRDDLLQPHDVAAAVVHALVQPRRAMVEEVLLMPSGGPASGSG